MSLIPPLLSSSSIRAARLCPQWPAFTETPGGAVFRRRVPRPTEAEEDDHSTGTETSLPGSWMHFVVGENVLSLL